MTTARTFSSIVPLQALKLTIENQRLLTIRLKCRIINGNRPRRNQRGSENAKERKSKECHERDIADGVRKLSTTRSLKVKLGAPGSKESRIVGKKMALEKRHVSSFIAAE